VKEEIVVRVFIQGLKKGDALNVIPMEMGEKYMGVDGIGAVLEHEALAQIAEAGAAIEDIDASVDSHLDAGGISTVPHVLQLRRGGGTTNSPESDLHASLPDSLRAKVHKTFCGWSAGATAV
jgi:hypothetical protein